MHTGIGFKTMKKNNRGKLLATAWSSDCIIHSTVIGKWLHRDEGPTACIKGMFFHHFNKVVLKMRLFIAFGQEKPFPTLLILSKVYQQCSHSWGERNPVPSRYAQKGKTKTTMKENYLCTFLLSSSFSYLPGKQDGALQRLMQPSAFLHHFWHVLATYYIRPKELLRISGISKQSANQATKMSVMRELITLFMLEIRLGWERGC